MIKAEVTAMDFFDCAKTSTVQRLEKQALPLRVHFFALLIVYLGN